MARAGRNKHPNGAHVPPNVLIHTHDGLHHPLTLCEKTLTKPLNSESPLTSRIAENVATRSNRCNISYAQLPS